MCGIRVLGFGLLLSSFSGLGDSLVMFDLFGYDVMVDYGGGASGEDYLVDEYISLWTFEDRDSLYVMIMVYFMYQCVCLGPRPTTLLASCNILVDS